MEATHFNSVDYFIFAILGVSILISFFRGFVREAISLIIWILAAVIAFEFSDNLSAHFFNEYITSSGLRYLSSFATLFLVVLILGALVNILITSILDKSGIGPMDRLMGIFFGAARGVLVVALMLMFVNLSNVQPVSAIGSSRLVPHFSGLVRWLDTFLPGQLKHFGDWLSKKALVVGNFQDHNSDNQDSDNHDTETPSTAVDLSNSDAQDSAENQSHDYSMAGSQE